MTGTYLTLSALLFSKTIILHDFWMVSITVKEVKPEWQRTNNSALGNSAGLKNTFINSSNNSKTVVSPVLKAVSLFHSQNKLFITVEAD